MEVILSSIVASATLIFTIIKFIKEKRIEQESRDFEQFRVVIDRVSGKYPDGTIMADVQQVAAIYQLLHFEKFKFISLPILEHYLQCFKECDSPFLRKAVTEVYKKLQSK